MGGPISVVLLDIYVCKMEEDIVAPSKPLFYKRYVDDTYVRRKKNETDELYNALNSYSLNSLKLPVHWTSKIPVRYKRNAIIGELHRAQKIASNFDIEINVLLKNIPQPDSLADLFFLL